MAKHFYFEAPATAMIRVRAETEAEALLVLQSLGAMITTIDCNPLLLHVPTVGRDVTINIDMERSQPIEQSGIVWSDRP